MMVVVGPIIPVFLMVLMLVLLFLYPLYAGFAIVIQAIVCRRNRPLGFIVPLVCGLLSLLVTGFLGYVMYTSKEWAAGTEIGLVTTFVFLNIPTIITILMGVFYKPKVPPKYPPGYPGGYPGGMYMGMPPYGVPPQGIPPYGTPPQGAPPQGVPPQGMPPQGAPPQGVPPQATPPQGVPPNPGDFHPPASPSPPADQQNKTE